MSTDAKGLFQNAKVSELNLCSDVKNSKRIVLQFKETGLHLGYHLDPVQGPAGCRLREVFPLPGACSPPYFRQIQGLTDYLRTASVTGLQPLLNPSNQRGRSANGQV